MFRGEMSMGDSKMCMRNSTQVDAQGKMVSEEFIAKGGAPEARLVSVTATRRQASLRNLRKNYSP